MKRFNKALLALSLAFMTLFTLIPAGTVAAQESVNAVPSSHSVRIDGQPVNTRAYLIAGSNFFMLRDIAYSLNGTPAQFEVTWDGSLNAINLITGTSYTPVGSEMAAGSGIATTATPSAAAVYVDGSRASFQVFSIGGNNFFMLRDLGDALGFTVDWEGSTQTVLISTVMENSTTLEPMPTPEPTPEPVDGVVMRRIEVVGSLGTVQPIYFTAQVRRNEQAHVQLTSGHPNATHNLRVRYATAYGTAAGLGDAESNNQGFVSWQWQVGGRTTLGSWPITITINGESFRFYFEVLESV